MSVSRQARHHDVMSPVEKIGRHPLELRGTGAHSVEQDDRSRAPFAVHVRTRAAAQGDTRMISSDKSLEPVEAGSQGRLLNTEEVHLLSEQARELIALEERYGAHNYAPLDLVVERAEGVWLWDVSGKRYLDCVSAYSALNQGHCHPRIYAALVDQARRVTLTSRAMRNDRMPGFLEKLTRVCGYEKALLMNTGVEAVETAIKLARRWGYARKGIAPDEATIVVFSNNFHGRTIAAVSASTTEEYRAGFGPFLPGLVVVPFGDADALERALTPQTAAVLIEPIQGEGGVIVPPAGYLKRVWALCREHEILLLADEVQTGFGRTGDLFACDYDAVKPDVLIVGKALGGGFYPVSATLASDARRSRQHLRRESVGLRGRRRRARRDRLGKSRGPRALRGRRDHARATRARIAADRRDSRTRAAAGRPAHGPGEPARRGFARVRHRGQGYAGIRPSHRTPPGYRR